MICTSRRLPRLWKSAFPAFFIAFHSRSGSMAIIPSAMDRHLRSATRKSCTGSALKSALTCSHSSSTRSIQYRNPVILLADFMCQSKRANLRREYSTEFFLG